MGLGEQLGTVFAQERLVGRHDILAGFQNELASILWVNTLQAREREKVLVKAIVAHMQAIDKLETMMTEGV